MGTFFALAMQMLTGLESSSMLSRAHSITPRAMHKDSCMILEGGRL